MARAAKHISAEGRGGGAARLRLRRERAMAQGSLPVPVLVSACWTDESREGSMTPGVPDMRSVQDYWLDAWQRSVLMLDVLRERGNMFLEQSQKNAPNVLTFKAELVADGRVLPRPVNYVLVRITPPEGTKIDPAKPPIIVVDPRAGHGPGIGGMKQDSEIGKALGAGHECYFIGFLPKPVPGQTIEDVAVAEAHFVAEVARLHPAAEGKPIIIANCQAGWQIMMMAAMQPGLTGPIMLAGTPLSYWAGVRGKNPMRYLGGVLGGTWMTALAGDLGHGIFDGAALVSNFESLNLANTYWTKPYNVYAKVDTEGERFLDFETWWGNPVLLNAGEMQWIADNLFVGNRLSTGEIRSTDGVRIDLRNIKSPIVIFCSWGDNITPPQQALDWILDLYQHEREIIENGQTIIYTMHQTIGHLGIFVSGKVASKEHGEFVSAMELIDLMPPGLYEAVITDVDDSTENRELVQGRYLFRLEMRTLDDIRAIGGNDEADERRFATLARVSDVNLGLYRTLLSPMLRAAVSEPLAGALRDAHPNRLRFEMFSDRNPFMRTVKTLAESVRASRRPAPADNPFLRLQEEMSSWITTSLQVTNEIRDGMMEGLFLNLYGSKILQSLVGLNAAPGEKPRQIERDLMREANIAELRAALEQKFEQGGVEEALARALFYVRLSEGRVDERGFAVLRLLRAARPAAQRLSAAQLKDMIREQYLLVRMDEDRALDAIPKLLHRGFIKPAAGLAALRQVLAARGTMTADEKKRLARIEALFAGPAQELAEVAETG
jgi:pimeloyl-ACP methyl ester carboxylesterase